MSDEITELTALQKWLDARPPSSSRNMGNVIIILIKHLDNCDVEKVTNYSLENERHNNG